MALTVPSTGLLDWTKEIIEETCVSRESRRDKIRQWKSYYWAGTADGAQAMYNRCFPHVDRLNSYLFSPSDVRFFIEFDETEPKEVHAMGSAATRKVNRDYHRGNLDLSFSSCVNWALVKGAMLHKKIWGYSGIEGWAVHPEFFGVLREDIGDLDRQEAFVETTFLTKTAFERTLIDNPSRASIMSELQSSDQNKTGDEFNDQDFFHQVIMGGVNPVSTSTSTGSGVVGVVGVPQPFLDPKVISTLVRIDELWVQDKKRNDYTTIRMVNGAAIVEGRVQHRNLSGVSDMNGNAAEEYRGVHPYTKVCPNEVEGYFWGNSEISQIARLQDSLNDQLFDLRRLTRLKSDPPRATIGFTGMTQEKYKILKRPGGFASEENPNAKIETLAPEIPPELFTQIEKTIQMFDDVAGFMPITQGVGEQGVRSGAHAQTLARNASPRMRDRALLVERQCVEDVAFCLKMWQAKKAEVIDTESGSKFMLSQLPSDSRVTVDSHTSSPAFQEDAERKAFNLQRAGAIDAADLIMLTHPPHEDRLVMRAKEREAAQAKFMQEHPELALKGKGGGRRK